MNKPQSAADFLADQARERGDDEEDMVETARSRLVRRDGALHLELADRSQIADPPTIDLSSMEDALSPDAAELLATGFALAVRGHDKASAKSLRDKLRTGALQWLDAMEEPLEIGDIDERALRDFKAHLDDDRGDLAQSYRKVLIEALQLVLGELQRHPQTAGRISPDYRPLTNLYEGYKDEVEHREIIKDLSFDDIVDAALQECLDTIDRHEQVGTRFQELDLMQPMLAEAAGDEVAVAWILRRQHAGLLPAYRRKGGGGSWFKRNVDNATYRAAERLLFPADRELVPFVVILSATFGLNPSVVAGMTIDDWEERRLNGKRRLRLFPNKPRAGRRQRFEITITDDPDHPFHLLEWLKARTQRLRDLEPEKCERRLFVRFSRMPTEVRPLELRSPNHRAALKAFIADNRLATFTMAQLRPTAMDRVNEITGDVVVTQAFANHASITTTEGSYPSRGRTLRNQQRLGRAMALRHADIASNWRIASYDRPHDIDKTAATPGFGCRNPYLGEIETEDPGVPCAAYGHCAGCVLATVDYGSARACAYLHELRLRIDEAREVIGAVAWIARWRRVKEELLLKIDRFPPAVREAARSEIITTLPPVE